jgi:hypothetical protein
MKNKTGLRVVIALWLSALVSLTLLGGSASAAAYPAGVVETLSITDPTLCSEDTATAMGTGFQPGETVTLTFQSATVATAVIDGEGNFTQAYQLPSNIEAGTYPVTAIGNTTNTLVTTTVTIPTTGCPLTEAEAGRLAAERAAAAAAAAALAASQKSEGLAFTGFQAASVGVVGLMLIGGGLLLTIASRRRRHRGHHGIDS